MMITRNLGKIAVFGGLLAILALPEGAFAQQAAAAASVAAAEAPRRAEQYLSATA